MKIDESKCELNRTKIVIKLIPLSVISFDLVSVVHAPVNFVQDKLLLTMKIFLTLKKDIKDNHVKII
jgi:hypothetical protein